MKQPKELTLEKLKDWQYYLTVGELRKALSEYPDDAKVLVQRVEDQYYDGVDISGGRLEISESKFLNIKDKAISAGEESKLKASKCTVQNSSMAIISKIICVFFRLG